MRSLSHKTEDRIITTTTVSAATAAAAVDVYARVLVVKLTTNEIIGSISRNGIGRVKH